MTSRSTGMSHRPYTLLLLLLLWIPAFSQLSSITALEYFFDSDPGFGNGIPVTVTPGNDITATFIADVSQLTSGFHTLYIRAMDAGGHWSLRHADEVYRFTVPSPASPGVLPEITAMEYFFDSDPGFGNGVPVPVIPGPLAEATFAADFSGLTMGFHTLYIRTKDTNDTWSLRHADEVYRFTVPSPASPGVLPDITAMEYFFDSDPGFGNGVPVPVTPGPLAEATFPADFSGLTMGFHTLYIRTKDTNGTWSLRHADEVYRFTVPSPASPGVLPDITAMEYFFDTDPGFGNGTMIPLTPSTHVIQSILEDVSGFGNEAHILYTRFLNANGQWSHNGALSFYFLDIKAFLEGPYNETSGEMVTTLNSGGLLPEQQPYGSDPVAKWYYTGTENVPSIPDTDIVDWLLIQARSASSAGNANEDDITETHAVFIKKDGSIVGLDGTSSVACKEIVEQNLYVVLFHRNHLGVISGNPVMQTGAGAGIYNFTTSSTQAYGGNNAHKQIGPGIWGLAGGDGSPDGNVNNNDKNDVWAPQAGTGGYLQGDFNMDGQTNNTDKNDIWSENGGLGSQVPDSSVKTESIPD